MIGLSILVVVQSAVGVAAPFFLRAILDHALPARDAGLVSLLALGMIGSSVAAGVLGVTTNQLANVVGQRIMHDLRTGVYGHLQRMSLAFFTRSRVGELLSRGDQRRRRRRHRTHLHRDLGAAEPHVRLAIAVALVILDWRLSVLALAVVPVFLAVTFRLGRQQRGIARKRQGGLAASTAHVEECCRWPGYSGQDHGVQVKCGRFATRSQEISDLELAGGGVSLRCRPPPPPPCGWLG